MGVDFIRKVAPKYHKSLDHRRVELSTPTLFSQQLTSVPRVYAAKLHCGQKLSTGEALGVRMNGGRVVVMRDLDPVATIVSPPTELLDALQASHGEGVGSVQDVHEDAGIAEIVVC